MTEMVRLPAQPSGQHTIVGPDHRVDIVRCYRCLHHFIAVHVVDAYPDADFRCPRCQHLTGYSLSQVTLRDFAVFGPAVPELELPEAVRSPKTSVPRFSERRPRSRRR